MRCPAGKFLSLHSHLPWAVLSLFLSFLPPVEAQVALTAGVQEVYDDNIFLEDEIDDLLPLPDGVPDLSESSNGDTDSDLITSVALEASTAPKLSRHLHTAFDARVGGLFFADHDDESRLTLDTLIDLRSTEVLLAEPWYLSAASELSSGAANIGSAEGTATRQAESHTGRLGFGIANYQLGPADKFSAGYTFARHDFLGEFLFGDREEGAFEVEGSDYISNDVMFALARTFSPLLEGRAGLGVGLLDYTSVESNDFDPKFDDDLDRVNYSPYVGLGYVPVENLTTAFRVGADVSSLVDSPRTRTVTLIDDDGTITELTRRPDRTQATFSFAGDAEYAIIPWSALLRANLEQGAGTDVDGDRIAFRSFATTFSKALTDRLDGALSGRFLQFSEEEAISDSTDRFEGTVTLRYSLTQALVAAIGYNFAVQDREGRRRLVLNDGDYESQRVFVSVSGGLVGVGG